MAKDETVTKKYIKDAIEDAVGVVLEQMDHNTQLILETIMPKIARIPRIEEDIVTIKQDIVIIKAAQKPQTNRLTTTNSASLG